MSPQVEDKYFASIFNVVAKIFATVSIVLLAAHLGGNVVAQNVGEVYREAGRLCDQGGGCYGRGNFSEGISFFSKAADLYKSINDTSRLVGCYQTLGNGFQMINHSDSSLYYYDQALELSVKSNDTTSMANCYMLLGSEAFNRGFTKLAEEHLRKASQLDWAISDDGHLSQTLCRLGFVYIDYADSTKSLRDLQLSKQYFTESLRLQTATNYSSIAGIDANVGLANIYIVLADFCDKPQYADSSLLYYQASLKPSGFGNYSHSLASQAYVKYLIYKKEYHEALDFMNVEQSFFAQSKIHKVSYHTMLSNLYEKTGDYRLALEHSHIVNTLQRQINSEENTRATAKLEAAKAAAVEHEKFEKAEIQRKQLRTFALALIFGLGFVTVLVVFFFFMARTRKLSNRILSEKNTILNSQKDEIAAQKDIIVKQMREVESVNDKLFSSIDYARRIQRATVTSLDVIKSLFHDSFLFFCPRDMVSGDFYRAVKCGRYSVMIIADCTGHGIPGALLSMLGISALKEYCNSEVDAKDPGSVLDKMRAFIKSTLSNQGDKFIDDGMDMTICSFDFANMKLRYATANQVAYILRGDETIKLKGDNMPIGHYVREKKHFRTFTVDIQRGDMVYMFTDGIQDQVGGPDQKRLTREQLLLTFSKIAQKPCEEQADIIENTIFEWKGDNAQVDDMTMVGIRV